METAERAAAGLEQTYDGFISYSHAADDLLAPRLQAGLQRFAKPWWKRRAVRIFRDESSLAANPHLWSSITEALNASGWFVVLLSEDAAGSEWVGKEIEHWVANKPNDRILPVLTDGEFSWENGDVAGSSVPPALLGVFDEEPRWVDLRFARDEDDLDLQNPMFSAAVADVASAIRGIPKDELASEEVKQHRRTVRTAWAAGLGLAVLTIAAVVAGIFAIGQRNDARDNLALAEQNAVLAEQEATRANDEADRASALAEQEAAARSDAVREARVAKSRELAASAISVLDEDPELSVMLAIESIKSTPQGTTASPEGVRTLREAVINNRLVARFDGASDYARISPDGSVMYYSDSVADTLVAFDIASRTELWSSDSVSAGDVGRVEISPDGESVTMQVHHSNDHQVFIFNASDGAFLTSIDPGEGCLGRDNEGLSALGGFSPGGEWFTVVTGSAKCGVEPGEIWVAVFDTASWEERFRLQTDDGWAVVAEFSTDGTRVLVTSLGGTAELRSFPDLKLLATHADVITPAALSPDGERMAFLEGQRGPVLADAETGELISTLGRASEAFFYTEPFVFSADGSRLLAATRGRDFVFDGQDGQFLGTMGGAGQTVSGSFTTDGSLLLTATLQTPLVWSLATGRAIAGEGFSGDWINPEQATDGPYLAVNVFDFEGSLQDLAILEPSSGEVIERRSGFGAQLPDGRFVLTRTEGDWSDYSVGPLEIWDPATDTTVGLGGCQAHIEDFEGDSRVNCPSGELYFGGSVFGGAGAAVSSPDGSVFAAHSQDDQSVVVIWDSRSLSRISEFPISATETLVGLSNNWVVTRLESLQFVSDADRLSVYNLTGAVVIEILAETAGVQFAGSVEFNADASLLFLRDAEGTVFVYETQSWELVSTWEAHSGYIRGWALSDTGLQLATAGQDGFLRVWNVGSVDLGETPEAPIVTVPVQRRLSDVVWLSEERLAVFMIDQGSGARWVTVFLDADDLVADAKARVTRGFTATECATYQIEDCPMTLEEMRSG